MRDRKANRADLAGACSRAPATACPQVVRLRQMALAESDEVILTHMQGLFRQELAKVKAKATEQNEKGLLPPGVTVEGVTWLFPATG